MYNTPQNQTYGPRGGMMYDNQQMPMYGGRGGMRGGMYNPTPQNQQAPMYGGRDNMRGGMYNNVPQNQQMPMYGGRGGRHGGRRGYGQRFNTGTPPYGGICPYYDGTAPNAQVQPGQAPRTSQMVTEEKVQEVADEFVAKYFPEYTVKSVEKDDWRPLYFVTIQGANDAEQVMTVHGFTGQVMNIFPKIVDAEESAE
jgi:hypothetical protein